MSAARKHRPRAKGSTLILSMIFVLIFSALAVSLATLSGTNVQVASNQRRVNSALYAAQSGLECAKYIVNTVSLGETNMNYVTDAQADQVWGDLCQYVQDLGLDGKSVPSPSRFSDDLGSGDEIVIPAMDCGAPAATFAVRFCRYDSDLHTIQLASTGTSGQATRTVRLQMDVTKDRDVLTYAMAGRGRMWLTGDTTIYGDIFSTWRNSSVAPFNTTSETTILGTVNTAIGKSEIADYAYQLETLDENGNPLFNFGQTVYDAEGETLSDTTGTIDEDLYLTDLDGNPVFDENGNRLSVDYDTRVYGWADELQGYHENVKYYDPAIHSTDMAGMDISDYDTSYYYARTAGNPIEPETTTETYYYYGQWRTREVPVTEREYFPHGPDGYNDYKSGSLTLDRAVHENQTFTDAFLAANQNALFRNCTFEGVLYVDCHQSWQSSGYCNNIRFENCTFNGVIVTNTPDDLSWQRNALYFTGAATFNNTSDIQEATILAPHFNVDLGNTNPEQSDNNVLTGAVVGGIVDIRGNAQIYGTVISMADTSRWTSGFVTNIGATLDDGGSETTELGDIGVISITPESDMMLPSGITSPIIIKPDQNTYSESV